MLFFISFSVVLVLNFRPLYYHDIEALGIVESSGISEEDIRTNYDTLISYNSIFGFPHSRHVRKRKNPFRRS